MPGPCKRMCLWKRVCVFQVVFQSIADINLWRQGLPFQNIKAGLIWFFPHLNKMRVSIQGTRPYSVWVELDRIISFSREFIVIYYHYVFPTCGSIFYLFFFLCISRHVGALFLVRCSSVLLRFLLMSYLIGEKERGRIKGQTVYIDRNKSRRCADVIQIKPTGLSSRICNQGRLFALLKF